MTREKMLDGALRELLSVLEAHPLPGSPYRIVDREKAVERALAALSAPEDAPAPVDLRGGVLGPLRLYRENARTSAEPVWNVVVVDDLRAAPLRVCRCDRIKGVHDARVKCPPEEPASVDDGLAMAALEADNVAEELGRVYEDEGCAVATLVAKRIRALVTRPTSPSPRAQPEEPGRLFGVYKRCPLCKHPAPSPRAQPEEHGAAPQTTGAPAAGQEDDRG